MLNPCKIKVKLHKIKDMADNEKTGALNYQCTDFCFKDYASYLSAISFKRAYFSFAFSSACLNSSFALSGF